MGGGEEMVETRRESKSCSRQGFLFSAQRKSCRENGGGMGCIGDPLACRINWRLLQGGTSALCRRPVCKPGRVWSAEKAVVHFPQAGAKPITPSHDFPMTVFTWAKWQPRTH